MNSFKIRTGGSPAIRFSPDEKSGTAATVWYKN